MKRCARCGGFYTVKHTCADLAEHPQQCIYCKPGKPQVVAKPNKVSKAKPVKPVVKARRVVQTDVGKTSGAAAWVAEQAAKQSKSREQTSRMISVRLYARPDKDKFDRLAYQRDYMRKWRRGRKRGG